MFFKLIKPFEDIFFCKWFVHWGNTIVTWSEGLVIPMLVEITDRNAPFTFKMNQILLIYRPPSCQKQASFSDHRVISFKPRRIRFMIPAAAAAVIVLVLTLTFIRSTDQGKFAYEISPTDSTMDVVNIQLASESSWRLRSGTKRQSMSVRLASYTPDEDEPAFSYPVHTRAIFVRSGVIGAGE